MSALPSKHALLTFLAYARSSIRPLADHELATTMPKARIFTIELSDFLYTLTTWGNGAFMQNELVFFGNNLIWSMSLQGRTIITSVTKPADIPRCEFSDTILKFVHSCRREPNEYRFAPGPREHKEGRLTYTCVVNGFDYSWLRGHEELRKEIDGDSFALYTGAFQAQVLISP